MTENNDSTNSRNEKRFTIQSDVNAEEIKLLIDKEQMVMWSFYNHDEAVNRICDLLNALHEEKEVCRKQQVRQANTIHQILKEKELLKNQVNEMIKLFLDSGLDYHISDELEDILDEDGGNK